MKEGEHYGKIPGCGDKYVLLKPGAEKLSLTFRLAPEYEIKTTELSGNHIKYTVICTLKNIRSGTPWGQGAGSCSTMESKFRYRSENTGKPVPSEYWNDRDPELIGGSAFSTRKVGGEWKIFHKVEHDNPADYDNTVLKMAKKRAYVDAMLSATAASDIFTQDLEDMTPAGGPPPGNSPTTHPKPPPAQDPFGGHKKREPQDEMNPFQDMADPPSPPKSKGKRKITVPQSKRLWAIFKTSGLSEDGLQKILAQHGCQPGEDGKISTKEVLMDDYESVCNQIESGGNDQFNQDSANEMFDLSS